MKLNRAIPFLFTLTAFVAAFWVFSEYIYWLGFPDGSTTELGRAERTMAYVFIYISLAFAAFFVYLGWSAGRMKIGVKLLVGAILYLICAICLYLIDSRFQATLMDGKGG